MGRSICGEILRNPPYGSQSNIMDIALQSSLSIDRDRRLRVVETAKRDAQHIVVVMVVSLLGEVERPLGILELANRQQPVGDRIPVSNAVPSILHDMIEVRQIVGLVRRAVGKMVAVAPAARAGVLDFS